MDRINLHHNIIAHGFNRNPQYAKGVDGEAINNITITRQRDSVDVRILEEIETLTGNVRDCVDAAPIYYPQGQASGGSSNTITVEHHPGDTEQGSTP
jgi:hypothetical protein